MAKYYSDKKMAKGSGFAGLPQKEVQKAYPKGGNSGPVGYGDSLSDLDAQAKSAHKKIAGNPYKR